MLKIVFTSAASLRSVNAGLKRLLLFLVPLLFASPHTSAYAQGDGDTVRTSEGWESGTFDTYRWERDQSVRKWEITTVGATSGRYCARSGNYYLNSTESVLQMVAAMTDSGMFSYRRKVSSESGYDFFRFYLDGVLMEQLSGEVDWDTFSCPVTEGYHRIKFVYHKDGSTSKGSDCAWLDDISWPGAFAEYIVTDSCPAPTGIAVAECDTGVLVSWDGEYRAYDTVIFDDIEGHTYGAINSPGTVGWQYIDGDSAASSTFTTLSFTGEGEPMAFIVLDDEMLTGSQSSRVQAHSGHRYLATAFHSSIANDDWLVSPELHFSDTFSFSFYARSYSSTYNDELFVAYYSPTGCQKEDFIPLHSDTIVSPAAWTHYRFTVPRNARYVAIQCVSYNEYLFCVDDISIGGHVEQGYKTNLYRDEALLAEGLEENSYRDSTATNGTYCYYLTHQQPLPAEVWSDSLQYVESSPSETMCITVGDSLLAKAKAADLLPKREWRNADTSLVNEVADSSHMAYTLGQLASWTRYPSYDLYVGLMHHFQETYPQLCALETVLDTTPHPTLPHSILALHISNTLGEATTKSAFLYSSTMHGDETLGYLLLLHLADYILQNAATDTLVQEVLDKTDLYILPLENPDGTYYLSNDLIYSDAHSQRRNYAGYDLNRNYPYLPVLDNRANVQPETRAMMEWLETKNLVMSANFHGGSEVFNLPWDLWGIDSVPHPDVDWFRYVCQNYASACHFFDANSFKGVSGRSVLSGGDWYTCDGTRQDYMNYYLHCREVTVELSSTHTVLDSANIARYWNINRDRLLSYILESAHGFWGTVVDDLTGEPIEAQVTVLDHDNLHSEVYSHLPLGVYHRPIMAGKYHVAVSAPCYMTDTFEVAVLPDEAACLNVRLRPAAQPPFAPSQYLLAGEQATLVALADHHVFWYASADDDQPLAEGPIFTTPPLYATTTYYVEERYEEPLVVGFDGGAMSTADTVFTCVSPRDSVMVWVIDTTRDTATQSVVTVAGTSFSLYPNPTSRYCTIQLSEQQPAEVRIYDMRGQLVLFQQLPSSGILDLSSLTPGTYLVELIASSQSLGVTKIVLI